MTAISLQAVAKSYGAVRAVHGLDLTIERGQTVALLGRNGAGKSTTIAMALGLLEPDEGSVLLFGEPPSRAVRRGRVGAMLQEGRPIERVTVRELITFVAGCYPNPMSVQEVLALAAVEELAGRRMAKLSGGQIQRVRFAVALAGNPDLLVLDEPTSALDVEARREFWTGMRAYARRGHTVLFSTHYLQEADEQADRVVVIAGGQVVADGTSSEIKRAVTGATVSVDLPSGTPAEGERKQELELLPGVVSVQVRGARAHLLSRDSDATVMALAAAGAVRNLEVTGADLEDAFLSLTKENQ